MLQTCLRAIHEEVARKTAALHKERNTTIPFHKLPAELITAILIFATHQHGSRVERLLELSTVSTVWWKLIAEAPTLWTTIRTNAVGYMVALERSKSAALDVTLDLQPPRHLTPSALVDKIARSTGRWRSARIVNSDLPLVKHVLEKELPRLEVLDIAVSRTPNLIPVNLGGGPCLHTIRVSGTSLNLENASITALERLSIQGIHVDGRTWASQMLAALSTCPCLSSIELKALPHHDSDTFISPPSPTAHLLPSLKTFQADAVSSEAIIHFMDFTLVTEKFSECVINGVAQLHPGIISALARPRAPNALGSVFAANEIEGDINIGIENGSLEFGSSTRNHWMELSRISQENLESFAAIYGNAPTWVCISDLRPHREPGSLPLRHSFLEKLPGMIELVLMRYQDAVKVLSYLSTSGRVRCPKLRMLRLHWKWSGDSDDNVADMANLLDQLALLSLRRPNLEVLDLQDNRYERDCSFFLGMDLDVD